MLIENVKDLIPIVQDPGNQVFGLDVETTGLNEYESRLLLIQLSTGRDVYVINYNKSDTRVLKYCLEMLKERNVVLVGHNIKFDVKFIYHNLGVLFTNLFDTQLAESLSFAGVGNRFPSLAQLAKKYLRVGLDKDVRKEFIDKEDNEFTDEQIEYASRDVRILLPLRNKLMDVLKSRGQYKTFELEMRLLPVVSMMEITGIRFDTDAWLMLAKKAEIVARQAHEKLNELLATNFEKFAGEYSNAYEALENIKFPVKTKFLKAGKEQLKQIVTDDDIKATVIPLINFNSSKQAKHIITSLGAKVETTNAKELLLHADESPIIKHVLDYREATKRQTSFGTEFLRYVNVSTGAIHAKFNQLGAVTGRFSSDSPNLQNIVSSAEYRSPFISREGYSLITTDYSNIELRIIGEVSREPMYLEAFNRNIDLHTQTASLVFNTPYDMVGKEQRRIAKSLNFAVIYGTSANGLAYNFNLPLTRARELLAKYFEIYPVLGNFISMFAKKCLDKGYSRTIGGRRRFLSYVINPTSKDDYVEVSKIERQAVNNLPQGTSADMIKLALVNMFYENPFGYDSFRPLITVHDEIVVEIRDEIKDDAIEFISYCMKKAGEEYLKIVPVEYSISVEKFWVKD